MTTTALPTIPTAEIALHKTLKSCYVTLGPNVYDVTDFVLEHPGGEEFILDHAGEDVSEIMQDTFEHEHSDVAYEILNERLIGHVATEAMVEAAVEHDKPDDIVPPLPNTTGTAVINGNGAAKEDYDAHGVFANTGLRGPEDLTKETDAKKDFAQHQFLDLDKPLLMQIWRSGYSKEFYLEQVHRPRYYKGGASAPLFGNFLEPLSLTPWWVVPLIWLPCVAYGTWVANQGFNTPIQTAAYWILGLCIWTLVEYGLHRGLFHVDKYLPDNRVGITGHFLLHGIHHYLPMDKYRLVMPPALFVVLATPFLKLSHTIFYYDWYAATAVFCGGIFGYICYDETHYFLHHKQLPAYYKQLKKYHLQHHYADYENGFGVTSRFWDTVFGTELPDAPPLKLAKAAKAA
ncbi:uncharacterized protein KY384_006638 [Bacidia gigantensis]|uniref:uncharacterized protein n=1 Tax=Bacidia gigantensis TaxID=2732470 RepID=UPI001D04EFB7|nr:uncharacterized protein KY384_006638 [Bacidia gigantensis]KAG8528949.1 hypothetical protein KY384_006638 [Bacidia gigantensis]